MAAPSHITDPLTGNVARVTEHGQLVVAPLAFSTPRLVRLDAPASVFNVLAPSPGQLIVITDVIIGGAKDISANTPAEVTLYTASSATSGAAITELLRLPAARSSVIALTGLNLNVGPTVWLNATTDDATVDVTVAYYYAPVEYP